MVHFKQSDEYPPLDIPVVTVGGLQAQSMRAVLHKANNEGQALEVAVKRNNLNKINENTPDNKDSSSWRVNF